MLKTVPFMVWGILAMAKDIGQKGKFVNFPLSYSKFNLLWNISLHRMYWLVAFILSVIVCYVLVSNVLEKWNQKPIIISFAERASHISEIPFPAILVCPIIKGRSSRFDYVDAYTRLIKNRAKKMTSDEWVVVECMEIVFFFLFMMC